MFKNSSNRAAIYEVADLQPDMVRATVAECTFKLESRLKAPSPPKFSRILAQSLDDYFHQNKNITKNYTLIMEKSSLQ